MRTILVGFDAFDPDYFENLCNQGRLPNLARFVEAGGYSRFAVSDPPQSEVSWTSIASGLNPGGHGIFDFVHRDPASYALQVSLLPTRSSFLGTQFVPPHQAKTIFDEAVGDGYPATSLWWPATFPARLGSPVQTIPGLGAPDIYGRLGVGFFFSSEPVMAEADRKIRYLSLTETIKGCYRGQLEGPAQQRLGSSTPKSSSLDFDLQLTQPGAARLIFGRQSIDLTLGQWSPIFDLSFKAGFGMSIRGITRAILTRAEPSPALYFLPLQAHPLHAPWPLATPKGFVKDLWQNCGPFLTLGWPQDTTSLEEGVIDDEQFLALCQMIFQERERVFMRLLGSFKEGVLACVFDSLDRLQHMFWRRRPDILERWYMQLDGLVGRVQQQLAQRPDGQTIRLLIISDHGFGNFDYKVHLNRWLLQHGYLATLQGGNAAGLKGVDWRNTQAYALGLNSLYLNLQGREGQGCLAPAQKDMLLQSLRHNLLAWQGPDGQSVVQRALTQAEAFQGPLAQYGPDLVIGYREKYRASAETGLGTDLLPSTTPADKAWQNNLIETNSDHWGADHCFDSQAVPGVLFSNHGLQHLQQPSYLDIPHLAIGKDITHSRAATPPPVSSGEDQETIEKRLKDLGYL